MESCLRNGAAVDMIQLARSLPGLGGQILYGSPSHRVCSHMGEGRDCPQRSIENKLL